MNFKRFSTSDNQWHDVPYYIHNTSTDIITSLPADVYADGNNATVGLKGNMYQASGVSPTTPIQPQETGERTGNLLTEIRLANGWKIGYCNGQNGDYIAQNYNGEWLSPNMPLTSGETITISAMSISNPSMSVYYWNGSTYINVASATDYSGSTFTAPANTTHIQIAIRAGSDKKTEEAIISSGFWVMINAGSTAKPYEPYGYKIPISSASTTTPVYLGEVESTRRIKKYEFTGQEDWSISNNERVLYTALADHLTSNELICYCSHYKSIANVSAMSALSNGECALNNTLRWFYIKDNNYNDATTFKTYLQQQYANGTPVTVWYVLATPETAILNEPLRKIGDYADTVSGITIPTITGKDTFDVDTTLKPSEVSLAYTGWHDATVKEWDGSDWQ